MSVKQEITKIADRLAKAPANARDKAAKLDATQVEKQAQQVGMLESETIYAAAKLETISKEMTK